MGDPARFPSAPSFASWCGLAPSEHSSGETSSRGGITRAGNAHVRRALVESAWHVPMSSRDPKPLAPGQEVAPAVRRHATKCNRRLIGRREAMAAAGKRPCVANCATAREMACWVWAIARMGDLVARAPRTTGSDPARAALEAVGRPLEFFFMAAGDRHARQQTPISPRGPQP